MSLQTSPLKMDMRPQVILNGLAIFPSLSLPRYLSSPHTSLGTVISTSSPNLSSVSRLQNPLSTDTSKSLKLKNVALTSHQNRINGLPCVFAPQGGRMARDGSFLCLPHSLSSSQNSPYLWAAGMPAMKESRTNSFVSSV